MHQHKLTIHTQGRGYTIITQQIEQAIDISSIEIGLLHVFLQHSSACI